MDLKKMIPKAILKHLRVSPLFKKLILRIKITDGRNSDICSKE